MKKKYFTEEEERKAGHREYMRKWRETPYGRALYLVDGYREMDRRNEFGDVIDFDAQWIVENIFTKKCAHCDCTDWRELGCNRINNDLPHTKSNVEPCCWKCNNRLAGWTPIPIAQYDKVSGELVAVWKNAHEVERVLGYGNSNISACCNGKRKSAYGFVWRKITIEEYEILMTCLYENT